MGVLEQGNKIYVSPSGLTDREVTLEWSQNYSAKSRQYYVVNFVNIDQDNDECLLYIQKDMLDSFKNKKTSEDDYTIIVDGSFQYSQNKERTKRWIVYHDRNCTAFQWRFVNAVLSKFGRDAGNLGGGVFRQFIDLDMSKMAGYLGEPLRNF